MSRPPLAEALDLAPHPEGGWYRQTWASGDSLTNAAGQPRAAGTLILFLLPAGEASAWHRVSSTELWITNGLAPVVLELGGSGDSPLATAATPLGSNVIAGETPQLQIDPDVWQRTLPAQHDALVSCLVSPGFDFADFELHEPVGP